MSDLNPPVHSNFWRQATAIASVALAVWLTIQTPNALADSEGHPLISTFKGSILIDQEVKEFDEQLLVVGKVQADSSVKTEKLEGKVTRVEYQDPGDRSSLERMRNYELSLKKAGFEVVFKCANEECGPEIQLNTIGYYPPQRYMTARLKRPEGNVWVGIYVQEGPRMKIWVVEEQPMETDMVSISADQLKESLVKDGHMAVYGILFDTGRAEIKPASAAAIKEIAAFLSNNPAEQIYVVGHTDNVGQLKDNMELSSRRAAAVVTLLTTAHKIDAARLESAGVGPLAPIASNETNKGRELNRRVEIVKK